jgi:bifunctional non-homologous end joining protein LigD
MFARGLAQDLEREHPGLVVSRMTRCLRTGMVLVDWSPNTPVKTTVSVYSLRGGQAADGVHTGLVGGGGR